MKSRIARSLLLLCLLAGGACDGPKSASSRSNAVLPVDHGRVPAPSELPLLDHPEYVHWKQFPLGALVVRKKVVENEHGAVRVTTRVRLAESQTEFVAVETQITVEHEGQPPAKNPPLRAQFPARFRLPLGMRREQFWLPSLKAKQVGEERREALGREFQTPIFEWDEVNETGPMTVKLWWCDQVPGRMLRQEIHGHQHESVEEVVEIVEPPWRGFSGE